MKRIMIPSVLLIAALSLTGCSAAASSTTSGSSSGEKGGFVAPDAVDSPAKPVDGSASTVDRSIITTGFVTVTAEEPLSASRQATQIVEGVGGRVDGLKENAPVDGDRGSANLTLRIPSAVLTATLEKLKALGKVEEVSTSASDVTSQVQDTDARIKALQASVDRLITLLSTASDADVLVTIESSLTDRQQSLEALEAQQRSLADQTSMATITLNLISVSDAPRHAPNTFWTGLTAGWNSFVGFFATMLVVLGVLLPWIVFLGIITFVIIFFVRRSTKKRALPTAALPAEKS
jgi:Domain of unknown function (DUF4349)